MNEQPVVQIEDVYFTYGCHPVLDGINLDVYQGESVVITGPNGAGKTTLLKLILGQLRPQRGRVILFGIDSTSFKERRLIGYISQNARLFNKSFPATAREVVAAGRVTARGLFRRLTREDHAIVEEVLEQVGMLSQAEQPIGTMSGGQQQRVLLARALAAQPRLLVLDEPTTGLDTASKKELYKILHVLNKKKKVTLVIVSHDVQDLKGLVSKRVCLGRKLCSCQRDLYDSGWLAGKTCLQQLASL